MPSMSVSARASQRPPAAVETSRLTSFHTGSVSTMTPSMSKTTAATRGLDTPAKLDGRIHDPAHVDAAQDDRWSGVIGGGQAGQPCPPPASPAQRPPASAPRTRGRGSDRLAASDALQQRGRAGPAGRAHGHEAELRVRALELVEQRGDEPGAARAERVA